MEINGPNLDAIWYGFNTLYAQAYARAEPWYPRVSMEVPSSSRQNRYAWLRLIPRLREWIGERTLRSLETADYILDNKTFEDSIVVKKEDIEDNQLGIFAPGIAMLGEQAKRWGDDLISQVIRSGGTSLCFDGQAYFSASHPTGAPGGGTYQNLWTGMPLNAANYATVRATMGTYVGEDGKPLRVTPTHLIVPPQLELTARQILNADMIASAVPLGVNAAGGFQSNVLKGSAELIVIPELAADPAAWYLGDLSKPVKPFVFQLRKAPSQSSLTDPNSDHVFFKRQYVYGVDARGAAGYSLPFLCAKAVG